MNKFLFSLVLVLFLLLVIIYSQNRKLIYKIDQLEQDIEASNLYIEKLNNELAQSGDTEINKEEYLRELLDDYLDDLSRKDATGDTIMLDEDLKKNLRNLDRQDKFIPDLVPVRGDYEISQRFTDKHRGIDFASKLGTVVIASATGIIRSTHQDKYFGNIIEIDHLNGYSTRYAHLAKILTEEGKLINKSDTIGLIGDTGNSTAPHLHFEISHSGTDLNPENILKLNK